ncbi:hypothetical protein [Paenibacillus thiaminolyticus]
MLLLNNGQLYGWGGICSGLGWRMRLRQP